MSNFARNLRLQKVLGRVDYPVTHYDDDFEPTTTTVPVDFFAEIDFHDDCETWNFVQLAIGGTWVDLYCISHWKEGMTRAEAEALGAKQQEVKEQIRVLLGLNYTKSFHDLQAEIQRLVDDQKARARVPV